MEIKIVYPTTDTVTMAYPTTDAEVKDYIKHINKMTDYNMLASLSDVFWRTFSCKPDREEYPCPKIEEILDEDKSVKWNREEVARLREAYENKVKELNRYKNEIDTVFEDRIVALLAKDYEVSKEESKKIWAFAYEQEHSGGTSSIVSAYTEFADTYIELLKIREGK